MIYEEEDWYMVIDGEKVRKLYMYACPEDDIKNAWSSLYPVKPVPLAASDDDVIPEPVLLLIQAESSFTICVYWVDTEADVADDSIEEYGVYGQPTSKLMRSMRIRVRWIAVLLLWHKHSREKAYQPDGVGFKRAREEFFALCHVENQIRTKVLLDKQQNGRAV